MIALSPQHMCFIATVSVATTQNTFSATTPTKKFGHFQKMFGRPVLESWRTPWVQSLAATGFMAGGLKIGSNLILLF